MIFSVQAINNATVNAHAELIQTGTKMVDIIVRRVTGDAKDVREDDLGEAPGGSTEETVQEEAPGGTTEETVLEEAPEATTEEAAPEKTSEGTTEEAVQEKSTEGTTEENPQETGQNPPAEEFVDEWNEFIVNRKESYILKDNRRILVFSNMS